MSDDTLSRLYAVARPDQAAMLDDIAIRAGASPESGARRVPLWNRAGEVTAWATVSAEDYERVASLRWFKATRGYAGHGERIKGGGTRLTLMHRFVLGLDYGDKRQADHVNRDKLDNRRENLRIVTQAQNNQNVAGGTGRSGVHGVHWNSAKGCWMARGTVNGRMHWLGHFDTIEEAGEVAAAWRRENVPFWTEAA